MTKAEYLTTVKNSGENPEQVTREASMPISTTTGVGASSIPDYSKTDLGLRCRPANAAATLKIAIFTLRLLLFYIVNDGAVNRGLSVLSRVHSNRYSRKKGKPL